MMKEQSWGAGSIKLFPDIFCVTVSLLTNSWMDGVYNRLKRTRTYTQYIYAYTYIRAHTQIQNHTLTHRHTPIHIHTHVHTRVDSDITPIH